MSSHDFLVDDGENDDAISDGTGTAGNATVDAINQSTRLLSIKTITQSGLDNKSSPKWLAHDFPSNYQFQPPAGDLGIWGIAKYFIESILLKHN